jgi:hypothetical protein
VIDASPVCWEDRELDRLGLDVRWKGSGNGDQIVGGLAGVEVDEQLDRGEGERRGGVDQGDARVVPAAGVEACAFAGEG